MHNEVTVINDLLEYMSIINRIANNDKSNFLYRGESQKYSEPLLASAFRPGHTKKHEEMQALFYKATVNSLTDAQKDNFMVFAQHHNMPTCLLDFSSNPLVALYFACINDCSRDGYIYVIEDDTIDITNILDHKGKSLFELVIDNDKKIAQVLLDILNTLFVSSKRQELMLDVLHSYIKELDYEDASPLLDILEKLSKEIIGKVNAAIFLIKIELIGILNTKL